MLKSRVELSDNLDLALKKALGITLIARDVAEEGSPEEAALWALVDLLREARVAADGIEAFRKRETLPQMAQVEA